MRKRSACSRTHGVTERRAGQRQMGVQSLFTREDPRRGRRSGPPHAERASPPPSAGEGRDSWGPPRQDERAGGEGRATPHSGVVSRVAEYNLRRPCGRVVHAMKGADHHPTTGAPLHCITRPHCIMRPLPHECTRRNRDDSSGAASPRARRWAPPPPPPPTHTQFPPGRRRTSIRIVASIMASSAILLGGRYILTTQGGGSNKRAGE